MNKKTQIWIVGTLFALIGAIFGWLAKGASVPTADFCLTTGFVSFLLGSIGAIVLSAGE